MRPLRAISPARSMTGGACARAPALVVAGAVAAVAAVASIVTAAAGGVDGGGGALLAGAAPLLPVRQAAAAPLAVGAACRIDAPPCNDPALTCMYVNTVEAGGGRGFPTPVCLRRLAVGDACSPRRLEVCAASACRGGVCTVGGGPLVIGDQCTLPGDCAVGECVNVAFSGISAMCTLTAVPAGGVCHAAAACAAGAGCVADAGKPVDPVLGPTGTCTGPPGRLCRFIGMTRLECALGTRCTDRGLRCAWTGRPAGGACQAVGADACADGLPCVQATRNRRGTGGSLVCRPGGPAGSTPTAAPSPSSSPTTPPKADGEACTTDADCTEPAYCREPAGGAGDGAKRCRRYVPPGAPCAAADRVCWAGHVCVVATVPDGGAPNSVEAVCVQRRWAAPGASCVGPGIVGCWDGYECGDRQSSDGTGQAVCVRRPAGGYGRRR